MAAVTALKNVQYPEKDCTPRCHSHQHADLILNCCVKGTVAETRAYCNWLCHNFASVVDKHGRNLLHMAAACGKWEIVQWLLDHCSCDLDVRDSESGWTALHRSFYYGQLASAQALLIHGANLSMTDRDGMTPLDLITADRLPYIEYVTNYPQEVYVWGSNSNFNLGLGNEQSRQNPEILEIFRKDNVHIKQVVMCKFHTCFLTEHGKLFTCGHGHGGRLGQGSEVTSLTPSPVHGLGNAQCLQVDAGQDHLVLLIEGGQVWTCGMNVYHVLGHSPPPERLVTPKPLSLKFMKGKEVIGVCAARFHTVFFTKDSVFTFGLNAGQLGHPKGDRTQISPRQVSGVYNVEWQISHVVASDGATVCSTSLGDVFVMHEFQLRKIASKQVGIQKLAVVGGHLDSTCDAAAVREGGGMELRVLILAQSGKLYLWRQSSPFLRRCLFTSCYQPTITDVYLNHYSVAMITSNNQGYLGSILPLKGRELLKTPPSTKLQNSNSQFGAFLDRTECYFIRAKRLPHIHRGTSVVSDSKGRNFAVLQASPKMGLLEIPSISAQRIEKDLSRFLEEASLDDSFADVVVKVGSKEYRAHRFILASRSDYFKKQFENVEIKGQRTMLAIDNVVPEAFEQVLKFLYCNTCDFLIHGHLLTWNAPTETFQNQISASTQKNHHKDKGQKKKKGSSVGKLKDNNPVKCVIEASRRVNASGLAKSLENVDLLNGQIHVRWLPQLPKLKFDCQSLTNLYDVTLCSEDGMKFPCHQCILAARSDYFRSMFGCGWIEKKQLDSLSLPISSKVLKVLLHYFYTDWDSNICSNEDPEFLCHVLAVADQLLLHRLKEICEAALVNLLTLKNATELVQLAFIYNAEQLKTTCIDYICINLPAIVEAKNFVSLSDNVMEELTKVYRQMIPSMRRRFIVPTSASPASDDLKQIEKCYPIDQNCDIMKQKLEPSRPRMPFEGKMRLKCRTLSEQSDSMEEENVQEKLTDDVNHSFTLDIVPLSPEQVATPEIHKEVIANHATERRKGQWVMSCPKVVDIPSLNEIMSEEKHQLTILHKTPSHPVGFKGVHHVSQKQRKRMAAEKEASKSCCAKIQEEINPQLHSPSAWGKSPEQSSSSESFWDSMATRESQSPKKAITLTCTPPSEKHEMANEDPLNMSLEAIQQAESEQYLNRIAKPKVKSLQLINIEEQAIEELLALYKAEDNVRERITVSRVLPNKIANPIWKKHA